METYINRKTFRVKSSEDAEPVILTLIELVHYIIYAILSHC